MEKEKLLNQISFKQESPKPKIFQYEGERIAIRLEPPFLRYLDSIAREYSLKTNALVFFLKQKNESKNFSSYLRSFLMAEAERRLLLSKASEYSDKFDFFMKTAPMPGLLLSENQTILHANNAFYRWSSLKDQMIREKSFTDFFYIKNRNFSIVESINRAKFGHQEQFEIDITFSTNDNIKLEAKALFCAYTDTAEKEVSFVVWFKTSYTERPPRIIKISRKQST